MKTKLNNKNIRINTLKEIAEVHGASNTRAAQLRLRKTILN